PTFRFDRSGGWSGGGKAFLNNVEHAEKRHRILRGGSEATLIIPRNVPVRGARTPKRFLLTPQNAWAWELSFSGPQELKYIAGLRLASEYYVRRASGVLRISSSIPRAPGKRSSSPIIHNVLDPDF